MTYFVPHLRKLGQRGVTFIELLLVMGLLSIFLMVIATIFTATLDTQGQSEGYSATQANGRFIMARLDYDIARCTAITSPATLGTASQTSNLILTIGGATYTYAVNGGVLQLTDGTGTDNLSSNDVVVSNINFLKLGNSGGLHTIVYSFTLTSTATHGSGHDVQNFTSTAERR